MQRQLSKSNTDAQQWRAKYEGEGVVRADELEESRRKLQAKLSDADQAAEAALAKVAGLEKAKARLQGELEDLMVDVERVSYVTSGCL